MEVPRVDGAWILDQSSVLGKNHHGLILKELQERPFKVSVPKSITYVNHTSNLSDM
jgi:hypothetical protein